MSNKIVPTIYRCVIDDVIQNIKPDFEEFGVSEEILAELQHKWERKVIASHVADFEAPYAPAHPPPAPAQHHGHGYPPHAIHMMAHPHYPPPHAYGHPPPLKPEHTDHRYLLQSPGVPYSLPSLPGPQLNGARPTAHPGGQQSVISFTPTGPSKSPSIAQRIYPPPTHITHALSEQQKSQPHPSPPSSSSSAAPQTQSQSAPPPPPQPQRIPQTDGPSSSSSESPSPPPSQSSVSRHSQAKSSQATASASTDDPEAINSDLDDSDTEGEEEQEEGGFTESDIVFCTYDKVARVKNKWKCILKDGMVHINGKDYLFAKCTGEFEW